MPRLYTPSGLICPLPLHITSVGRFSDQIDTQMFQVGPSWLSLPWAANNRAQYAPISVPSRFTVARFLVANGGNATGNVDVGLYSITGNLLISTGTTARSGTNVVQYIGVTDQSFPAGQYYLALVGSSTTGQYMATLNNSAFVRVCGWLQENLGSTVLPTTMSPASNTNVNPFSFGFTQSDTL